VLCLEAPIMPNQRHCARSRTARLYVEQYDSQRQMPCDSYLWTFVGLRKLKMYLSSPTVVVVASACEAISSSVSVSPPSPQQLLQRQQLPQLRSYKKTTQHDQREGMCALELCLAQDTAPDSLGPHQEPLSKALRYQPQCRLE